MSLDAYYNSGMMDTFHDLWVDEQEMKVFKEKGGGFFDLPQKKTCRHPEHRPPSHIHIPQGKGYRHVCPGCGNVVDIIPQQVTL